MLLFWQVWPDASARWMTDWRAALEAGDVD